MREAAGSVVKVLGTACGLGVEGSGWVAGPELVVTNAHVVAGQDDTRVLPRGREPGLRARPSTSTRATTSRSCACDGLGARRCRWRRPRSGTPAAILGFPLNGPYDVRAGRLGRRARASSSGRLRPRPGAAPDDRAPRDGASGNSGGPMVDGEGRVVTTVFAATTAAPRGGYGVPNAVVRGALAATRRAPVSTGPCAG